VSDTPSPRPEKDEPRPRAGLDELGDFTASRSMLRLVALAIPIGVLGAFVALGLLDLIALISNVLYHGSASATLVPPGPNGLGAVAIIIPIAGGLVIGLMARYGSEQIRGHGIPEAMENILVRGSRVQPRLAILKPLSSAISIGTGGPFGAEGPIILTGGAFGSLIAQHVRLSAAERKTLLVAGAAAGMSGVFGTPVAAAMLGVELLLFEWKPRSAIPVGVAAAVAMAVRIRLSDAGLIHGAPLFPVPEHAILDEKGLLSALIVGLGGGLVAWALTGAVYGCEDAFGRLPIHWAWWPAIGGIVVGVGGLIEPRVLGVGYNTIADELAGRIAVGGLVVLLVMKLVVWSVALGSGTSGGILAPLLIIGAAMGGALGSVLPGGSAAIWGLVGMTATMAGVMRSPFTSVIFAFELTHDQNALLPLLIAAMAAHLMSVLVLKRSILTEKVARKGVHVTREYAVDPLEALFVRDVMTRDIRTVRQDRPLNDLREALASDPAFARQRLYPVVDEKNRLVGVLSKADALTGDGDRTVEDAMRREVVTAREFETLRGVADRMVADRVGAMPVVDARDPRRLLGMVSQFNLFRARVRLLEEERLRERGLRPRRPDDLAREAPRPLERGSDAEREDEIVPDRT
jgi:H+/Cl- antiporter ClcA